MAMLEVRDLEVNYGSINAIKKISFDVNEGEVIALIGANGAGKTTTLHTITGLLKAKSGSVMFEGKELLKTPPHKIVEMGMAHVPEGRRIFQQLTVYKNLTLGAFTRKDKASIDETLQMVYGKFPRLEERKKQLDQEYIFWLLLVLKNEARGNPAGYRKNIMDICKTEEICKLVKSTPVEIRQSANKLLYLTLKYPSFLTVSLLRLAMIWYYRRG